MPPVDKPNYTQIPNAILDALPSMTSAEVTLVMAICRQTFGWHRKSEKLSLSQLQALTGMSRQTVADAIDAALEHGWISRKPSGQTYRYTVNVHEVAYQKLDRQQEVAYQKLDRSKNSTSLETRPPTVLETRPQPYQKLDRQQESLKKEKETIKESTTTRVGENARVAQPQTSPTPAVAIWRELTGLQPNQSQTDLITKTVTDCALWRSRLTEWLANGHKPTSVMNQLDVYAHGWKQKGNSYGKRSNGNAQVDAADDGFTWPDGTWHPIPYDPAKHADRLVILSTQARV